MKISHAIDNNVLVLTPCVKFIDSSNVKEFKKETVDLINKVKIYKLVFNLENVTFIDSMGLGSLISILKMTKNEQGDVRIASVCNTVKVILELIRLNKIIKIFADPKDAVESFEETRNE